MLPVISFYGSELTNCQKPLKWRGLDSRSPTIVVFFPLQQMSLASTGWWGTAGAWLSLWLWTWLLAGCAPQNTTTMSRRWSSAMPQLTGWVLPNNGAVLLQALVGGSFEGVWTGLCVTNQDKKNLKCHLKILPWLDVVFMVELHNCSVSLSSDLWGDED